MGPWRIRSYARLASTSDLCLALAARGEPDGLAVRADAQSAGRGRSGRAWHSAPGNLFLSVLLRPSGNSADAGFHALLAGVALREALASFLPDPSALTLKWPNDLLLAGRKLAGILLESASAADGTLAWLVIGIGANLASAPSIAPPSNTSYASACLADAGIAPPPAADAAHAVLARLGHWRTILESEGFPPIRAAWLAHAHPLGAKLAFNGARGMRTGRFAGLTGTGALKLETGGGIETFASGEVLQELADVPCSS
jgi:BirA family biotin operon repressor/biotin-[acetyl-CoA-carboxylase] ligase